MVYHRDRFNKRKRKLFGRPPTGSFRELVSLGDRRPAQKVRLDARRPPFTRVRYERAGTRGNGNEVAMLNSSLQRQIRDGARMLTLQETQQGSMREFEARLRAAERDVARLSSRPLRSARELDGDIAMGEAPLPRARSAPRADAEMQSAAPARGTPPPPPVSMDETDGATAAASKPAPRASRPSRDTSNPSAMIAVPARTGDDAIPPAGAMRQQDASLVPAGERSSSRSPGEFPASKPADAQVGALVSFTPSMPCRL